MTTEPARPKPKRRWFQYSLRTLLVLMTVTAFPIWWLASERQSVLSRKLATAAIKGNSAATIVYDHKPVRPAWRRRLLGDDADAEVIEVTLTGATDAQLARLAGLTNLKRLTIEDTLANPVTDAGLAHLAGLKKLEELTFRKSYWSHWGQLIVPASIESYPNVGDAGLAHLGGLTNLKRLVFFANHRVTSAGMVHLGRLKNLEHLSLSGTQVSDDGLVHLAELTNLETLRLDQTRVSDFGMVYLTKLTKLKKLAIWGTGVEDEGYKTLKDALPKLEFESPPGY